jgi:hypothetical protein
MQPAHTPIENQTGFVLRDTLDKKVIDVLFGKLDRQVLGTRSCTIGGLFQRFDNLSGSSINSRWQLVADRDRNRREVQECSLVWLWFGNRLLTK